MATVPRLEATVGSKLQLGQVKVKLASVCLTLSKENTDNTFCSAKKLLQHALKKKHVSQQQDKSVRVGHHSPINPALENGEGSKFPPSWGGRTLSFKSSCETSNVLRTEYFQRATSEQTGNTRSRRELECSFQGFFAEEASMV